MTKAEARTLPLGLYRIFWKGEEEDGYSVAAVGMSENGDRWLAPTNWVAPGGTKHWRRVSRVEFICGQERT